MDKNKTLGILLRLVEMFPINVSVFVILSVSIQWHLAIVMSPYTFPIGIVLTFIFSLYLLSVTVTQWRIIIAYLLVSLSLLISCYLLSLFFLDYSFDGQAYHMLTSLLLQNGWNPYHILHASAFVNQSHDHSWLASKTLFISSYYPRGFEILIASINLFCEHIVNPFFIQAPLVIATFLVGLRFLSRWNINITLKILTAMVIAANPILVVQVISSYNDGFLGFSLTMFILYILDYLLFQDKISLVTGSLAGVLLINTKFTGLIFFLELGAGFLLCIYLWQRENVAEYFKFFCVAFIVGFCIIGYQPYITNAIHHHFNIFYPVLKVQGLHLKEPNYLVQGHATPEFLAKNRIEKFIISQFSLPSLQDPFQPLLHFPFPFRNYTDVEQRFSGFGATFGLIFFITLPLLLFIENKYIKASVIFLILSLLSINASWWARYAPQTWLIPVLIMIGLLIRKKPLPYHTRVAALITGVLLFNSYSMLTVMSVSYANSQDFSKFAKKRYLDHQKVEIIDNDWQTHLGVGSNFIIELLREYHIPVNFVAPKRCLHPQIIPGSLDILACVVPIASY